jgi:hypothetical protein
MVADKDLSPQLRDVTLNHRHIPEQDRFRDPLIEDNLGGTQSFFLLRSRR